MVKVSLGLGAMKVGAAAFVLLVAFSAVLVNANVFLHTPRGTNNRLQGDSLNPTRLFRSNNVAAGGYGVGPSMSYYAGSALDIEFSLAQGCDERNGGCEVVLQYLCSSSARDGTVNDIAPESIEKMSPTQQQLYGYHESAAFFTDCSKRDRNSGLFTADLNLGETARSTRQTPEAQRHGFECPEERDYYPYWHPTEWRDIAIITTNTSRCAMYKAQSQNVAPKGHCRIDGAPPGGNTENGNAFGYGTSENNQKECVEENNHWFNQPAWGLPAPECVAPHDLRFYSVDGIYSYRWKIPQYTPEMQNQKCVLRVRYNVSSSDYNGWEVDSRSNGALSPVHMDSRALISPNHDLILGQDSRMIGSTFEDRSHAFAIVSRPSSINAETPIWNLNVRGKRGLRSQVFPALPYGFTPDVLEIARGDYIHFQWTGSDSNPADNFGQGLTGTDRSNIAQIEHLGSNSIVPIEKQTLFPDLKTATDFALQFPPGPCHAPCDVGCCRSIVQLIDVANGTCPDITENGKEPSQQIGNCALLNSAPAYFNKLVRMDREGVFHYMSTRNNIFGIATHKGSIFVGVKASPPNPLPECAPAGQDDDHSKYEDGRKLDAGFYTALGFLIAGFIVVSILVGLVLVRNSREERRFQEQERRNRAILYGNDRGEEDEEDDE